MYKPLLKSVVTGIKKKGMTEERILLMVIIIALLIMTLFVIRTIAKRYT